MNVSKSKISDANKINNSMRIHKNANALWLIMNRLIFVIIAYQDMRK